MTVEVDDPGEDTSSVVYMDPQELKTRFPFNALFPIDPKTQKTITESMRKDGFDGSKPINVWFEENVVVDGHTRLIAAIAAGITLVPVFFHSFANEDAALEYAVANQRDRRNLTGLAIVQCVKTLDRRRKSGERSDLASRDARSGKSARETANKLGVSSRTVERARAILDAADEYPDIKQDVEDGTMSLNKAVKEIKKRRKEAKNRGREDNEPEPPPPADKDNEPPPVEAPGDAPPPVDPDPLLMALAGDEEPPPSDPPVGDTEPPFDPSDPFDPVGLSDEERGWLESLPLWSQSQVYKYRFYNDILVYWHFWQEFQALRDEMHQCVGSTAPVFQGTLYAAVDRLGTLPPPETWTVCEMCAMAARTGYQDCHRCGGSGYVIPGF